MFFKDNHIARLKFFHLIETLQDSVFLPLFPDAFDVARRLTMRHWHTQKLAVFGIAVPTLVP